eukprot:11194812-Lingulodinium_polyedra.AAC.1
MQPRKQRPSITQPAPKLFPSRAQAALLRQYKSSSQAAPRPRSSSIQAVPTQAAPKQHPLKHGSHSMRAPQN